jgi:hypothetical protein
VLAHWAIFAVPEMYAPVGSCRHFLCAISHSDIIFDCTDVVMQDLFMRNSRKLLGSNKTIFKVKANKSFV